MDPIEKVKSEIAEVKEQIKAVSEEIKEAKEGIKSAEEAGNLSEKQRWVKKEEQLQEKENELRKEKNKLLDKEARLESAAPAGPSTTGTGGEIVERASAVANDVVVLAQERQLRELFELGWHQRLLPSEVPFSHDSRYQLLPDRDLVTVCLERDWFEGVFDQIVEHLINPAAQRWMEIAGPSGIGKSNGLVSIANRLLIWAAQERRAGRRVRIFPILNAESLLGKETWADGVQAALGAGFHDDKEALAAIPQLELPRDVSHFVQRATDDACWLIDQAHGIFQDKDVLDRVSAMTALRHAVFVSSGGGTRASEQHARHLNVRTLPLPTAISPVDIHNWESRYTVPFKSSAAARRLDMLADNLLLRYTFWQSCGEVGVPLPPLSDDVMKTLVPERPSKRRRLLPGEVEATSEGAVHEKLPTATGGASASNSEDSVSFGAAWTHFLKSKAVQALFSDLMGTLQRYILEPEMLRYVKDKCMELALATTWVDLKPGVFSGRDFLFEHSGSELLLKAQPASDIVRFALAQAAEAAVSCELAFTGCMGKLLQELGSPDPHPALIGILAERVVGERLQQGAGQAYFGVKTRMRRVRKFKQDQVERLVSDLLEDALKVLSGGKEEQHVTLGVPDEFNARDTDFHMIVIQKAETKGAACAPRQKLPQTAADPGPSASSRPYAGLTMHVHGIQVTTSDLLRHAHSEDHAMHPQRANRWCANVLSKEQVEFSFLFVAPEKRLGRHTIDEQVPEGRRALRNGEKVIQVAHRQVLLPFGAFDDGLARLDQWPEAWLGSIEGTWAVTEKVKNMLGPDLW
eukprot:TRINITY_DN1474_c0_g1_i1.p1 TRINITY_DN1474_c0_g1~~TRINITY_DN1474_c0_g1_i1.p1  ORF type:complete len:804 (-),score=162.09 TRINITY_DN1474_c0_g1_i1:363-2774(-)